MMSNEHFLEDEEGQSLKGLNVVATRDKMFRNERWDELFEGSFYNAAT